MEGARIAKTTIDLDETAASASDLLASARNVINELVQGFGVAESPQITAEGALRRGYFRDRAHIQREAERVGVDVVDESL